MAGPYRQRVDRARPDVARWAAAALWLLPAYGLLLCLSTITHEPDHTTRFGAWSEYVTTDIFLVSHVAGSIIGAGLGLVGTVAALLFLVHGPRARGAFVGVAMTLVAGVAFAAVFGLAAFTQPAIGRAFLAGTGDMPAFYDDVYGSPMLLTFGLGALLFVAGAVTWGIAVAGTGSGLRVAGVTYAVAMPVFLVSGLMGSVLQPVAGLAVAVAGAVVALRLPKAVAVGDAASLRPV